MSSPIIPLDNLVSHSLIEIGGGAMAHLFFGERSRRSSCGFCKILTPISAPIVFGLLAATNVIKLLLNTANFLLNLLFCGDDSILKESASNIGENLINILLYTLAAVVSPLVNTVDVVGSALTFGNFAL